MIGKNTNFNLHTSCLCFNIFEIGQLSTRFVFFSGGSDVPIYNMVYPSRFLSQTKKGLPMLGALCCPLLRSVAIWRAGRYPPKLS